MFYRLKYNPEFEAHQNEKEEGRCVRAIDPTKSQPKDDGVSGFLLFQLKLKISYYFVSLYQTKLYEKITQKRKAILVIVYRSRNIALIVCDEA